MLPSAFASELKSNRKQRHNPISKRQKKKHQKKKLKEKQLLKAQKKVYEQLE